MKKFLLFGFVLGLFGCASVDKILGTTGSALDNTGAVLSGDLRPLSKTYSTTLSKMCKEFIQNEV